MSKIWWVKATDLDVDQKKVMELPPEGKHLVTGPPGSGKSNLLVLRARFLLGLGKQNFRVLAFTQPLVRFLRASRAVPDEKISTATKWLDDQLWQLQGKRISEPDMNKRRPMVAEALLAHLRLNNKRGLIHTLLVDEIQDYSQQEIELYSVIAEHLFMVGDIRQQIHTSDTTHHHLEAMRGVFNVVDLEKHYRIGRNICELADRLAKVSKGHRPISDGCLYDEPKNPSSVARDIAHFDEQMRLVAERIAIQLDTFPGELIGVLCPQNQVLDAVAKALEAKLGDVVCVQKGGDYQDFDPLRPVILSTIHGCKGLEYRCVHVPSAESLKTMPRSRELIYTAVTRARTTVSIYHDGTLNDFLEDALSGGGPPPAPPTLASLFT